MLAHSPPGIPLIIDHIDNKYYHDLTPVDEEGIILALQLRDRVRRIRIMKSIPILQKLIIALDGQFPILEFLLIWDKRYYRPLIDPTTNLDLPQTFWAPHLRQLLLWNFATPIESPQLTNMRSLITLSLGSIPSSAYFHPNVLLQRLSLLPQLEVFRIQFRVYNPSRDVESQLWRTRVTLPNLRWFGFRGTSAYLEVLLPWVTIPLLEQLRVYFFNRIIYSIPHLRQFMSTAQNLLLKTAKVISREDYLRVVAYPHEEARYNLDIELGGKHFDWQVVSAAQVLPAFKTVFSAVEDLTFEYVRHNMLPEWNRQANRTHWRELLGSFGKVKTLRVERGLVEQVSRALQPGEGEPSTELLPELQELSYSRRGASRAFSLFIDARKKAGRPLTVDYI